MCSFGPGAFDRLLQEVSNLTQESANDGLLSFLDQQLKLNSEEDAENVARLIETTQVVKALELRGNTLGPAAANRIAQALLNHPELQRCLWSDLFTGRLKTEIPPVLKSMCSAMMQVNCRITELDLSDNAFGPIGAEAIQDFLLSPSAYTLETLKLNNCGLGPGGKVIASCLLTCHANSTAAGTPLKLKTFLAGRNRLEDPGATALAEAFKAIGTLEELVLHQDGIRAKGIEALAACLPFNPNLRIINFNDNTATVTGSYALAKALKSLKNLEYINFGDCLCRDAGCHAILDSFSPKVHTNLKEVDLSGAELSADAAIRICSKWSRFPQAKLLIGCNNFGGQYDLVQDSIGDAQIDLGTESDDQGSLSDDEEERISGPESDEEESDGGLEDVSDESEIDLDKIDGTASLNKISSIAAQFRSSVEEAAARSILGLAEVLEKDGGNLDVQSQVATLSENILKKVQTEGKGPVTSSSQLANHLIAQLGFVKTEVKWNSTAKPVFVGQIIQHLMSRGLMTDEAGVFKNFLQ